MRIFVAIDIPADVATRIGDLIAQLKPLATGLRWSRAQGLHVTLKFLGEAPPPKVDEVARRLAAIPFPDAIDISIQGSGYFPNASAPRVVWLGIQSGPALAALAARIDSETAVLGFQSEKRAYAPHLTLARTGGSRIEHVQEALRKLQPLSFGSFVPREFFLYESKPHPSGSEYIKIARFGNLSGDQTKER